MYNFLVLKFYLYSFYTFFLVWFPKQEYNWKKLKGPNNFMKIEINFAIFRKEKLLKNHWILPYMIIHSKKTIYDLLIILKYLLHILFK